MNKIEFRQKFDDICSKLNLNIPYTTEDGLVISNDYIKSDKIVITIKDQYVNKNELIQITKELFDYPDRIINFINDIYNANPNNIVNYLIGYANGNKELYFELVPLNTPLENKYYTNTQGYSYDEHLDKINN